MFDTKFRFVFIFLAVLLKKIRPLLVSWFLSSLLLIIKDWLLFAINLFVPVSFLKTKLNVDITFAYTSIFPRLIDFFTL